MTRETYDKIKGHAVTQSDAEPVAWRYMAHGRWSVTTIKGAAEFWQSEGCVVEPLYTALAQSNAEPVARARYHLRAADHALHEVEGDPFADHAHTLVHEAAFMITDEPELQVLRRLPESGAVLAQSDAEPFAWRYAYPGYPGHWNVTSDKLTVDERQGNAGCIIEPLYTTTPRPDASAGLTEAAGIAEGLAREFERRHNELKKYSLDNDHRWIDFYPRIAQGCEEAAQAIRARAADRSGK